MKITKKDVEHVALLGRVELTEDEKDMFTRQLNDILGYMDKLNELNTDGVEPTSHAIPLRNVFREDRKQESLDRELALSNAPEQQDGYFRVPKILE